MQRLLYILYIFYYVEMLCFHFFTLHTPSHQEINQIVLDNSFGFIRYKKRFNIFVFHVCILIKSKYNHTFRERKINKAFSLNSLSFEIIRNVDMRCVGNTKNDSS